MTRFVLLSVALFGAGMLMLSGCESPPTSTSEKQAMKSDAQAALERMQAKDESLKNVLDTNYGYVIFPSVGKGGFIVGGSHGKGEVYEQGRLVGYAVMNQATVGAQAGGQEFAELIVFKDKPAFDRFTQGNFAFAANASAIALKSGAGSSADFKDGVAVFTMPKGGLMLEAAIGGQKFSYSPIYNAPPTTRPSNEPGYNE